MTHSLMGWLSIAHFRIKTKGLWWKLDIRERLLDQLWIYRPQEQRRERTILDATSFLLRGSISLSGLLLGDL